MAIQSSEPQSDGGLAEESSPAIPDYLISPNAVFKDEGVQWRYGRAPDYSKTRKVWEEGKSKNHAPGSLEEKVENLVKNWEVEASFKPRLQDWRTIDPENYTFAMGNGPPISGEDMIKVGTYNAIIAPNEYYSPKNSDFASSHKTFKRMMPTFAWEVLDVYSGPPEVAFRWRHWGYMKNDYVGFNDKGEKVTARAHGGIIDIQGVTIAKLDDKLRVQDLRTWMDPLEMFRQIAPQGVVEKHAMNKDVELQVALDMGPDGEEIAQQQNGGGMTGMEHKHDRAPEGAVPKPVSRGTGQAADACVPRQGGQLDGSGSGSGNTNNGRQTPTTRPATSAAQPTIAVNDLLVEGSNAPPLRLEPTYLNDGINRLGSLWEYIYQNRYNTHATSNEGVTGTEEPGTKRDYDGMTPGSARDAVDEDLGQAAQSVPAQRKEVEVSVEPQLGEAVAAEAGCEQTQMTHEEMSRLLGGECPFLVNRE